MSEGAKPRYLFTVFTPSYNRAHTLGRVWDSLKAQTFRDFEWLIIDDGSTDGTRELVASYEKEAPFPIRYFAQKNQGKHIAFNWAIDLAEGELLLTFDSDDACLPSALERLRFHWLAIPEADRPRFSAVTGLCVDQNGKPVGNRFPRDVFDSDSAECYYRHKVRGEKWGFQRTDVLRQFKLPEARRGEMNATSQIWNEISRAYRTRYVNEVIRIYYIEGPSLTHQQPGSKSAVGGRAEHLTRLNKDIAWIRYAPFEFLRSAVHYARFSFHRKVTVSTQLADLENALARGLWLVALPIAYLVYLRDE